LKLLFLANRLPYPPYRGDKLKIYNLAKRLCGKHELHLLTFTETEEDKKYIGALKDFFTEIHTVHLPKWRGALYSIRSLWKNRPVQVCYFQSREMQRKLNALLTVHQYDAVHVQHLRMAPYLSARKDLVRILDLPDAFSLYWKRRSEAQKNPILSIFQKYEAARLSDFESIVKDYNLGLVCSQEDLNYLQKAHHFKNLHLLPNGVDLTTFKAAHDYAHNHTLLFTGNMDYAPNVDAVNYFAKAIFPLILTRFPKTKFIIAGQRPVAKVKELASENIIVTGFVKNLSEIYNDASIVVSPLRFGAGTQNKVLEAMACGVPVVCSNIGFNGLNIENGEGAIMKTSSKLFAEAVCELLVSASLRENVGAKGLELVKKRFDWDVIAQQLEQYFIKAIAIKTQ